MYVFITYLSTKLERLWTWFIPSCIENASFHYTEICPQKLQLLVPNKRIGTASNHRGFFAHLAYTPMSPRNHDLSVMCHCHCHWCHHCHHHHWSCCLCTAVPVTPLLRETLYLTNTCIYTPSICTWNIESIWHILLKWQPF